MNHKPQTAHKNRARFFVGVFLVCMLLSTPLSVSAFFSGEATGDANAFSTATLQVGITPDTLSADIEAATSTSVTFDTTDLGSTNPQYRLTASANACSGDFFNGIDVVATQGSVVYTGSLSGLMATSTSAGTWHLDLSATGGLIAAEDETCDITLTVLGWQEVFADEAMGFSHTQTVDFTLTAAEDIGAQPTPTLVLNEIYPSFLATTTEPLDREWVELYNGTGSSIDVLGWALSEVSGATTEKYTIVASGASFSSEVQPYGGASTVIPAGGLLVIEFGGTKLNNDGDTVGLYDASDVLLDAYTYPNTVAGKSHARIPDGSTWVDPIPTPGTPNMATEEDLRNEGWSEERIKETLLQLNGVVNECTDGIDNDGDGWFDDRDSGCEGPEDMIEGHPYEMEVFLGLVDPKDETGDDLLGETGTSSDGATGTSTPPIEDDTLPREDSDGQTGTSTPSTDDTSSSTPLMVDVDETGTTTPSTTGEGEDGATGTTTPLVTDEGDEDVTDEGDTQNSEDTDLSASDNGETDGQTGTSIPSIGDSSEHEEAAGTEVTDPDEDQGEPPTEQVPVPNDENNKASSEETPPKDASPEGTVEEVAPEESQEESSDDAAHEASPEEESAEEQTET